MPRTTPLLAVVAMVGAVASMRAVTVVQQQPPAVVLSITGDPGALPRYAVPDFLALSADPDTIEAAKVIGQVLWDDLDFEREFDMIPRDTYASIPPARSLSDVPLDRWRELGADGLVIGTVQRVGETLRVDVRLFAVRSRQSAFDRQYTGTPANPRFYAHTIADEIFRLQGGLQGVARTRLAFVSDRDGERIGGTIEARGVKEIYVSDYDGANQRRFTVNRNLNLNPSWSPDGRALAYTSYRGGRLPEIFISMIYQGTNENPTRGQGQNFLPAWSPDGTRLAFMSDRDGNNEIYVMNRDGSGVRRLTNHPDNDATPTWSPSGTQVAFTSNRTGMPQIYVVGVDGLGLTRLTSDSYCDRPTWSPAPYNEIAYSARTGPGFDIKVIDMASREVRQITFGQGSNESPSYAPNGRHLAFSSTRGGKRQIYTMTRTGKDVRQITRLGTNQTPDWSR